MNAKDLLILAALACTVALGLRWLHSRETPPPQDIRTGLLKGTVRDAGCDPGCDPGEMTMECNGSRPR